MIEQNALRGGASRLVIAVTLAAVGLAACQPNNPQTAASSAPAPLSAIPLATSGAPPLTPAPASSALPPAPPARVGSLANPSDRYAFVDGAYAQERAFGDAPPDYTFDYGDGSRPWVWRGDNQATRVAEPLPGGGFRYYYYEPGARSPYLVRDSDYSYAYDNGVLVAVYDRDGRPEGPEYLDRRADIAGRILARAVDILLASQSRRHEAVAESHWRDRQNQIDAEQAQWRQERNGDPDWEAYHAQHQQQQDDQWAAERYRREAEAARFAQSTNDTERASRDWRMAQDAQAHAGANTQQGGPQGQNRGFFGFGPKAPPAPPPVAVVSQSQSGAPVNSSGPGQNNRDHGHPPGLTGPTPPLTGENTAAQADAARQAQAQAKVDAAHKAQIEAQMRAQALAQAQAQAQADAAHKAQIEAQMRAQALAQAQAQAKVDAAHKAQIEAQMRAQALAQAQAQAQADAAHKAQIEAQMRAQALAQAQAQAKVDAAHKAQIEAQMRAQALAQAQAARIAAARAAANAAAGAASSASGAPPSPKGHPHHGQADSGQPGQPQ